MGYKYELDSKVRAKQDMTIPVINEETEEEFEVSIPSGAEGEIFSCGRSSVYGYHNAMYDVTLMIDGEETEVTFFEKDLEEKFEIMNTV